MGKIYKYTNIVLEVIQKNNRKINAIIRKNQIRRIKVYIMLISVILTVLNPIYAIEDKEAKVLCRIDSNIYVKYYGNPQPNYEYYYFEDGEELPVYCVNLGMKGAEEEKDGYLVNSNINMSDSVLKNIVLNSYPYKSIDELGVESKEQAKFASQFAIWIYTANLNIDFIEPTLPEYQNVVDAIKNIYYSGINSNYQTKALDFKSDEQKVEKIEEKVYYTKIIYTTNTELLNHINVTTKENNVTIEKIDEGFKVYIPVNVVDKSYDVKLDIELLEKTALYGTSTKEGYQDVVLTTLEKVGENQKYNLNFEDIKKKIIILKKDKETDLPLKGVVYEIRNQDNEIIGEYETDESGKIELEVLEENSILVKEIKTLDEYILDDTTYSFKIEDNNSNVFELYNTKKKGNIKIIKKSKEYNELTGIKENMPLENVSFYIYDENMNLIDDITTDEYGCALTKKLPIGKYYIKEYKTQQYYQLSNELIEVEIINNNEITNVEILNNNVNIPKKLPTTGR